MVENQTTIIAQKSLLRLPDGTYVIPYTDTCGSNEIGDIGIAVHVDESEGLRRYLNGSKVIIDSHTTPFLNKLKSIKGQYPNLFCSEEEWQQKATANEYAQCGKFVINEDGHVRNVTQIGAGKLNRAGGVVSGFSSSARLITPNAFQPGSNTWEIVMHVHTPDTLSGTNIIIGQYKTNMLSPQIQIQNTGLLWYGVSVDGAAWTISVTGTKTLELGADYYVKLEFTGTQYIGSIKKEGDEDWVVDFTSNNTSVVYATANSNIEIGADIGNTVQTGSINLDKCYIKVADEIWWQGSYYVDPYIRLPKIIYHRGTIDLNTLGDIETYNYTDTRYLVTKYTSGTNWYNLYSDGYVEQGGQASIDSAGTTVNLLRTMSNTNYYVGANAIQSARYASCYTKTTSTFKVYTGDDSSFNSATICWMVTGYSAAPSLPKRNRFIHYPYYIQISKAQVTRQTIRHDWEIVNPYTLLDYRYSYYSLNNASWLISNNQYTSRICYPAVYEALCVEADNTIQTGETVVLPSSGRYTKHLQTLKFDKTKLSIVGSPIIQENGLLIDSNYDNYVKVNAKTVLSSAKNFELYLKFQFMNDKAILCTSVGIYPNGCSILCRNNKVLTQLSFDNTTWEYQNMSSTECIEGNWYYLKLSFNNTTGYKLEISEDNGLTYNTEWTLYELTRLAPESNFLLLGTYYNLSGTEIDLKTLQLVYNNTSVINCNIQENIVWNKAEHAPTEADYDKKFIVDTVNETFRLPLIVDRELNNGELLYFYVGDVAQNTSLIDIGRLTESLAKLQAEVEKLKC